MAASAKARARNALRRAWLQSPERAAALKRDKYTCQGCLRKASVAKGKVFKVQVHHCDGLKWAQIDKFVEELFAPLDKLTTLCRPCHDLVEISGLIDV